MTRRFAVLISAGLLLAAPPIPAQVRTQSKIDAYITAKLATLHLEPAAPATDAVFVRRVYLDVIGTLPSVPEVRTFLTDPSPDKRAALIDRLLERDEFADYWAMKWCDLLRVKSEFPINLWPNAVQAYHHWIRDAVRTNLPYDQFVRALLTSSGSNFRVPPVNFYRAVQKRDAASIAQAVALTFMGTRTDAWPKERLNGMAGFFSRIGYKNTSEWKEEIVYFDPDKEDVGVPPATAIFPDGAAARLKADVDPRQAFADWLITPSNPWFTTTLANRVWFWLMGRGLVQEPDDFRPDNPPSHPDLLAYLAQDFAASRYDVKHLFRSILNSATYQQSATPASDAATDDAFAHYLVRPLDAEVLIDALCQITGTSEQYSSAIPEPYTFLPEFTRAIQVADGSISSPFLVTFGRPPRDTGMESERTHNPTPAERLHLLNSSHVQRKVEQSALLQQIIARGDIRQAVTQLYATILSRTPTDAEMKLALDYAQSASNRRQAGIDLAWALINTTEFLYRH